MINTILRRWRLSQTEAPATTTNSEAVTGPPTLTVNGRSVSIAGTHPAYDETIIQMEQRRVETTALATALAKAELPSGALIFDVGAHVGLTSIIMALLRPDCRIIAFEPVPDAVDCLRQNLRVNSIENVRVFAMAITDHANGVRMTNSGPWSVVGHGDLTCESARLDDCKLGAPDFIKIDVEGSEPNVLAGAASCLAHQPFVFMEFNTWTLLLQHYDPVIFADALIANSELLGVWGQDQPGPMPATGVDLLHINMMQHYSVTDILFRPRPPLPPLEAMTDRRPSA